MALSVTHVDLTISTGPLVLRGIPALESSDFPPPFCSGSGRPTCSIFLEFDPGRYNLLIPAKTLKSDLRNLFGRFWGFEELLGSKSKETGYYIGGKLPDLGIIIRNCLIISITGNRQSVFGALKLILKLQEVFIGFELRIIFNYHQ